MAITVEEFLDRKGGVGVLSVLKDQGLLYSEIASEVAITSDTISKRLDEALDIGLIEVRAAKRRHRTVKEYHLTEFGEAIVERLAIEGVVSNYRSMRDHQERVEKGTESVIAWLTENGQYFESFPEATAETLIDRTTDEEGGAPTADGERDVGAVTDAPTSDIKTDAEDLGEVSTDEGGDEAEDSPSKEDANSKGDAVAEESVESEDDVTYEADAESESAETGSDGRRQLDLRGEPAPEDMSSEDESDDAASE